MLISLGASNDVIPAAENHSHDAWEIVVNTYGKGKAMFRENEYTFEEGTIMCIPPHLPHGKTSDNGFKDLYFHVNSLPWPDTEGIKDEPIILQDDAEHSFESLVTIMLHMLYSENSSKYSTINSLYHSCINLLTDWRSSVRIDPAIEKIQSLLISGYSDPELDINSLLASTGYSTEYLRKKFKNETGESPLEYLTNLRISHAKLLLEQRKKLNLAVKDIAFMCGFYNTHYFSSAFKKITGVSPKDYALNASLNAISGLTQKSYPAE